MKGTRSIALVLAVCTALFGVAGCSSGKSSSSSGSTTAASTDAQGALTVTDMNGDQVELPAPATKVVALTAADCEILYAIGAGDTLIGRGEYCDYPDEIADVSVVQSGSDTNVEQVLALQPDVVIMSTMDQTQDQIDAIRNAGVPVVVTNASDIEGVFDAITLIGQVVGHEDEATELVDQMKSTFDEVKATASGDGTKSIYFEASPLEYGLWTAGSGTFMDEIASMLGLRNAFADVSGWSEISEEQVIERNPDYIVTFSMGYGETDPVADILGRTGWADITAVKDKTVYQLDSDEITRPGPRLADAAVDLEALIEGGATQGATANAA